MASKFNSALIVVDLQEDFCPPRGTLAVKGGRDITPAIDELLSLPFVIKIATKDWHPRDHISFASNHPGKSPFTDLINIVNPVNSSESYETRLWPDHCIQHTKGAEIISELNLSKIDLVVEKGQRKDIEMYSAFYDPLERPRISDSGLAAILREKDVTDVVIVGLAFDYCVKYTAIHAAREGYRTTIVREGTRAVDPEAWEEIEMQLKAEGVDVIDMKEVEIPKVGKFEG